MKNNMISDARSAFGIFKDMRRARKDGTEIVIEKKKQLPLIQCGGFYNTVEGCTLSWLDQEIVDQAIIAFYNLPDAEKHRLQFSPEDGEFIERAKLWRNIMGTVMTEKQCHIAMNCIIHWYIHIKQMRFGKAGAAV